MTFQYSTPFVDKPPEMVAAARKRLEAGETVTVEELELLAGMIKAFADGRQYYMLAYVPTNETPDGNFRKIEVKVHDNKQ